MFRDRERGLDRVRGSAHPDNVGKRVFETTTRHGMTILEPHSHEQHKLKTASRTILCTKHVRAWNRYWTSLFVKDSGLHVYLDPLQETCVNEYAKSALATQVRLLECHSQRNCTDRVAIVSLRPAANLPTALLRSDDDYLNQPAQWTSRRTATATV